MNRFNLIIINVIIVSSIQPAFAEVKILGVEPALIDGAIRAKELIFRRRYDEAYELFKRLEEEYPDSPTGLAGQMAVWQVKMLEHDDFRYERQFKEAEKRYTDFSHKRLRKGSIPSWDLFVFGAADGLRGFFKTRKGEWLSALSASMHAMRMLKQLRFQEPAFIDVDLGFGAYIYWRSAMTKEVKILPFFADRRQEGINLLLRVARDGKYVKDMALGNLVFIYGNENRYNEAVIATDQLIAKYPENIIMRYQKGRILIWAKRYDQAIKMFEEVYKMNPAIYKALLYQGSIYYRKGDLVRSKRIFNRYLAQDSDKEGRAAAYFWLGAIAEAEKRIPDAVEYYKKSLELDKIDAAKKRLKELIGVRSF